jgi:hypothetical protein
MNWLRKTTGWAVDHLPLWLWHSGNLYSVPGGDMHFCVDHDPANEKRPVRVIEFSRGDGPSRVIAMGFKEFPFDHPELAHIDLDEKWGFIATWRAHRRRGREKSG